MSLMYIINSFIGLENSHVTPDHPNVIGEFIADDFSGGVIDAGWDVPSGQTVSVGSGSLHIVGQGSGKDVSKSIQNIGYGMSTLRNYKTILEFKINVIDDNTKGIYVGVESSHNNSYCFSTYAYLDFSTSTGFSLEIIGTDNLGAIGVTPSIAYDGLPEINTEDRYRLSMEIEEGLCLVTFENITQDTWSQISYGYNLAGPGIPLRPNIFRYSFGAAGSSDVNVYNFTAGTTEKTNAQFIFVGDSITTGYNSGAATNSYAYKLKANTSKVLQINAGGGNTIMDVLDNMPELLFLNAANYFIMIGTNSGGTITNYQQIMDALFSAGKNAIPLLLVNGGNPYSGGGLNQQIATSYPSLFLDTWTTGWNTMSVGNGEMSDELHPTNAGMIKLSGIIKSQRPEMFPL